MLSKPLTPKKTDLQDDIDKIATKIRGQFLYCGCLPVFRRDPELMKALEYTQIIRDLYKESMFENLDYPSGSDRRPAWVDMVQNSERYSSKEVAESLEKMKHDMERYKSQGAASEFYKFLYDVRAGVAVKVEPT